MDITKYQQMLTETVAGMLEFMHELDDCAYTQKDVEKCEKILSQYLASLAELSAPTDKEIMKFVKKAVVALNKLNEKADYELIESVERDNICEIIQASAVDCGLQNASDDITEEWREW